MDVTSITLDISLFLGLFFQLFLLVTFFEAEKAEESGGLADTTKSSRTLPTVTIIVPCFNESKTVEKTVLSLMALNYPKDKLSILIVDDGSSDDTFAVASVVVKKLEHVFKNISVVRQENGGKYTALNRGIKECTTEFVGCLDADSMVDPEALTRMIPYFENPNIAAVTPAMRVHMPTTTLQYIQRAEYNVGVFTKKIFGHLDAINVTPGPFSIFRRSVFDTIGLFRHAHNTEDMEIAFRIQSYGFSIANCHTAFVHTITPPTFRKLYRQRTRWSYGFIKNLIDYKHIIFNRKYGNMGMFTLPFAIVGIFFLFYFAGQFIYHMYETARISIERWLTIGIRMPHLSLHGISAQFNNSITDLYFKIDINTVLTVVLLSLSIYIAFKSKKLAEGSMRPSRDIFYFLCFYSFLAPLWIGKAVYNVILSKKTPWR